MQLNRLMRITLVVPLFAMAACAAISGMQKRFTVCNYDNSWQAALDAVKDRSISTKDKAAGLIVTTWLEVPMPGRSFGAFQRELADSRDRSRIVLTVKQLDDVAKISFVEQRESWGFRGGSRLFGWAPTDPSEEVMHDVQQRLDAKLKEQGCSLT